jgi:pimeloyl-ACP methyl ester carboxylesterase
MLGMLTVYAALIALPGVAEAGPTSAATPSCFREWFDAACSGRVIMPDAVERNARRFRYVFVGGFHNERMPGYFGQNAKELRARGVPRKAIHFVEPSSRKTVADNIGEVRDRFLAIAKEGPEKLVVIAHSRGACDALAFALCNPEFVRDRVESLFLVQGTFGGTALADYVVGDGPPIDGRMPLRHRVVCHFLAGAEALMVARGWHGGLSGLTRRASSEFWSKALAEHSDAVAVVGPKTYYVTSATTTSRLRLFKKAASSYLGLHIGPNDGMVALEDQSVAGVGTVLAVLDAGHGDLTNRFPSSRRDRRLRRALIDGILMTVGTPQAKGQDRLIAQLYTVEEFPKDFTLKLEFRASVNADSGIFIRKPQLQCRDYPVAGPYKHLKKYKPQDWNLIEVIVKGGVARCTCNGEVLESEFNLPETGPIGLEGDRGQMEYRRIQIK